MVWCGDYSPNFYLGRRKVQEQLDGATRNKTIFEDISKKMHESGYERDWQQCRAKIKNLKADYKKVKDHDGVTGNGWKTVKFYNKLDEILGHRTASVPFALLQVGKMGVTSRCHHRWIAPFFLLKVLPQTPWGLGMMIMVSILKGNRRLREIKGAKGRKWWKRQLNHSWSIREKLRQGIKSGKSSVGRKKLN